MLTNRMPSFSLLAAGSFILRLHLTTPSTQTSKSTTLTTPATTPAKKVPTPRGALSIAHVVHHLYRSPCSYTQESTQALSCLGCMHAFTWVSCGVGVGDNCFMPSQSKTDLGQDPLAGDQFLHTHVCIIGHNR